MANLEKFKKDLDLLINEGNNLRNALLSETIDKYKFHDLLKSQIPKKTDQDIFIKKLPNFYSEYQIWYSEARSLIKLLLPDRFDDFIKYYEPSPKRKNIHDIDDTNYVISDALNGTEIHKTGFEKSFVAGKISALPKLDQQIYILKSVKRRFESSLFDIKQVLQADLFDSEIEIAKELNNKGFIRAAGAIAGVVLEGHLKQVCKNHNITVPKNKATINPITNELLKDVLDLSQRKNIDYLASIRNKCDHKDTKLGEPTKSEVEELLNGTNKIIHNIF